MQQRHVSEHAPVCRWRLDADMLVQLLLLRLPAPALLALPPPVLLASLSLRLRASPDLGPCGHELPRACPGVVLIASLLHAQQAAQPGGVGCMQLPVGAAFLQQLQVPARPVVGVGWRQGRGSALVRFGRRP